MSWGQYFARQQAGLAPPAALRSQLDDLAETALSQEKTLFHVLDIDRDSVQTDVVETDNDLDRILETSPSTGVRIISISSTRTIMPLRITSPMAARLFDHYSIRTDFLRVLLSFGGEPHQSEAISANSTFASLGDDSYTLLYKLNYVENNGRKGLDNWSFRHIGVYNHHTPGLDLFLLLHSQPSSEVCMTLDDLIDDIEGDDETLTALRKGLSSNPAMLHHFVLSSYIDNWRTYLRHLGDRFSTEQNKAMVPHLRNRASLDVSESFQSVRNLRNTNDLALFAAACCRSNLDVTSCILRSGRLPDVQASELQSMETTLHGYIESSGVLRQRINNTVELASYMLSMRNQQELQALTRETETHIKNTGEVTLKLKDLTENTVDDSAIVRIITIISAIYLPGSFVGSIFGSNYFSFNETTRRIAIARDFWVFALLWLGLTLLTAAVYVYTYMRKRKPRSTSEEAAERRKVLSGFSTESKASARGRK